MSHHDACTQVPCPEDTQTCLTIDIATRTDGSLVTTVRFPEGPTLVAEAGNPDLGFEEPDTCLHDVAHTLLAARLGLRSPVLERVVELRPLSQDAVDLEEAAVFALQAWCLALRDEDAAPAIRNALTALRRAAGS